jgi:hypothetical protein
MVAQGRAARSTVFTSSGGAGADLGSLRADLLEAVAALPARDGEGSGAVRRIASACGDQKLFIANEPFNDRSLSGPGPF